MNVAAVKKFCTALPSATGDIKWGIDQVYSIGGKMFCVAHVDQKGLPTVGFKVDDDLFLSYTDRAGFIPAPYLARAKWVQVTDLKKVPDAELKSLIKRSHELIAMKLTKKCRTELGIG